MESRAKAVKEVIVGTLVGIAAMLPGISGAVICVCFGIYERLVRDIAKLRYWLRADFWFILYLAIGVLIGTLVSAKILSGAMEAYPTESLFLFVGLIAGQIPAVYYMTGPKENGKPTNVNIIVFVIGLIIMASMLAVDLMGNSRDVEIGHSLTDMLIMFAVGLVVAVSALVPGISHSTVLIVFGLFTAFTNAISDLDFALLLPLVAGVVVGALLFSKVVHYALEKHHRTTSFLILGLTVGSLFTLCISSAMDVDGAVHAVGGAVTFVIGVFVSIWFMKKSAEQQFEEEE